MAEETTKRGEGTHPPEVLARLLNLTPRRLQQLAAEGIIPRAERGLYELVPVVQGYVKYLQEMSSGQGDSKLSAERARLAKEQADKAARENALARGELVPAGEVTAVLEAAFGRCRARLLAVPAAFAAQVAAEADPKRCHELLTRGIHDALRELAATRLDADAAALPVAGDGGGDSGGAGPGRDDSLGGQSGLPGMVAAAAVDGEPVGRPQPGS